MEKVLGQDLKEEWKSQLNKLVFLYKEYIIVLNCINLWYYECINHG